MNSSPNLLISVNHLYTNDPGSIALMDRINETPNPTPDVIVQESMNDGFSFVSNRDRSIVTIDHAISYVNRIIRGRR